MPKWGKTCKKHPKIRAKWGKDIDGGEKREKGEKTKGWDGRLQFKRVYTCYDMFWAHKNPHTQVNVHGG